MPPKRYNYKKPSASSFNKKASSMYSQYQRRKSSTRTMVNRSQLRDHTIVADRFLTKLSASMTGYYVAATASSGFTLYGNGLFDPFTTSNSFGGTLTEGASLTAPPIGFTSLSGLYNAYRVRSSRIKINFQPTNILDVITAVVLPVTSNSTAVSSYQIMNNRYSKWKTCTVSNNVKENTIIHYMNSHEAIGLTKQQYDNQLPTQVGSAPVALQDWFWQVRFLCNEAGAALNAVLPVTIEVDYYCEFSDPISQSS